MATTPAPIAPPLRRVPIGTKIFYGLGSVAYGIKDNGFSTLLLLFYNQVVGLPAQSVGLAIMAALVIDAFADPLIGHFSDQTRGRWGRRHPFMYAAALPVALLYLLLWRPPAGDAGAQLMWLFAMAVLVRTAISCYEVPSAALAPELTGDYHERTSVLGWRYLFGWAGGMGMALLTFVVILAPTPDFPMGQLNPAGYRTYAMVAAGLMAAFILVSAAGTHREIPNLPQPQGPPVPLRASLAAILGAFRGRAFVVLLLAGAFGFANSGLNYSLSTYFNTFLYGLPASALGALTVAVLLGVVLALLVATPLARRWGKRGAAVRLVLAYLPFAVAPLLLFQAGFMPARGSGALLLAVSGFVVVSATLGIGFSILAASMMADVVEDAQARGRERSEGTYFAGSFFMQKCATGIGLFLSGSILSLSGFPAGAQPGEVPPVVLAGLVNNYCALTVLFGLISAAVLSRFPIDEAGHRANLADIAAAAERGHVQPD